MRYLLFLFVIVAGTFTLFADTAERLVTESRHTAEFVPVTDAHVDSYKCTNVNFFILNWCRLSYRLPNAKTSDELFDWRFGRAPSRMPHLLQLRDDPTVVTTDVSLDTLGNRTKFFAAVILVALFFATGAVMGLVKGARQPA